MPHQARGGGHVGRGQPRGLGVVHVGHDQHRGRMLLEAVGHLLQRQAHVLEADLLADDVEGRLLELVVQGAHHPRQHRAVADAGVEQPDRRGRRMQARQLLDHPVCHLQLLAAGVDEHQVLLPALVETERARGTGRRQDDRRRRRRRAGGARGVASAGAGAGSSRFVRVDAGLGDEGADAGHGLGRGLAAGAQTADELAVVHRQAPKGGLSRSPARRQ